LARHRQEAESSQLHIKLVSFIRHGQSEANLACDVRGNAHGIWDPHLTDLGIAQVKARGEELKMNSAQFDFDLIVVSPLTRTLETCMYALSDYIER
jgi:broad specificity phosphatase PhoE